MVLYIIKSIKSICANREPVDEIFVYQFIVSSILLLAKLAQIGAHDGASWPKPASA